MVANHQRLEWLKPVEREFCQTGGVKASDPQVFHVQWNGVQLHQIPNNVACGRRHLVSKAQIILQTRGIEWWRERRMITWRLKRIHPLEAILLELDSAERQQRNIYINPSPHLYSPKSQNRSLRSWNTLLWIMSMKGDLFIQHSIQSNFSLLTYSCSCKACCWSSFDRRWNHPEESDHRAEWTAVEASLNQ